MIVVFVVMDPIVKTVILEKFSVKIIYADFVPKDHVVPYPILHLNYPIRMNILLPNVKSSLFVIIAMKQVIKPPHVLNYPMKNDKNISICHRILLKTNNSIIDNPTDKIIIPMVDLVNSQGWMINIHQERECPNHFNMMSLVSNVENEGKTLERLVFSILFFASSHYANKCTRSHVPYMRNQNIQRR